MAAQARPTVRHGNADFSGIRAEFGLPADYPTAALVEAEQAVSGSLGDREDATDLPMVTVDPPGAKDLDQAMLLRRRPRGG
ncbi:MAG TPA: RNB domain-containing ribonuclease, partial [Pseudonocardiaceae bacterium]